MSASIDHLERRDALDGSLELALRRMTSARLRELQDALHERWRTGSPSPAQLSLAMEALDEDVAAWLRFRDAADDGVKAVMLLGALAVANAWLTHRHSPATVGCVRRSLDTVSEGHAYMLPIPRSDPCLCGSPFRFKACHGRPPVAAPAV